MRCSNRFPTLFARIEPCTDHLPPPTFPGLIADALPAGSEHRKKNFLMTAVVIGCVSVAAVVATLATLHSNNRPAAVLRLRRSALFGRGCLRSFLARTTSNNQIRVTPGVPLNAFSAFFLVCHRSPLQDTSSGGMSTQAIGRPSFSTHPLLSGLSTNPTPVPGDDTVEHHSVHVDVVTTQ